MRNNIVAVAILAAAASAPIAARAQTVGVAHGTNVIVEGAPGIAVESYPAFREYVIGEQIPNHTIPGSVAVGTILPDEEGITFHDVPPSFATTPYRYAVVNGETVLVEIRAAWSKSSQRLVQFSSVHSSRSASFDAGRFVKEKAV